MTKSERLMFIMELLRNNDGLRIEEIASRSETSERTAYRDINSLYKMRIPLVYRNGYRIEKEDKLSPIRLSPLDRDLIRLSLRINPLNQRKAFRERLKTIEEAVVGRLEVDSRTERSFFVFDGPGNSSNADKSDCLATFGESLILKKKVSLRWIGGSKRAVTAVPMALKVDGPELSVQFRPDRSQAEKSVPVDKLTSVKLSD
ncbi:MAG: HTH domain-containing protein [bacterium]|nr:HTH domain-containing protein [bacterium]